MMNKVQKDYMLATAAEQAIKEDLELQEAAFLKEKGYTVSYIWQIDDQDTFDVLNHEFAALVEAQWQEYLAAKETLKVAEDALIAYGLSIFPFPNEREVLAKAAKTNQKVREQLIDLTFRLDTSTVA